MKKYWIVICTFLIMAGLSGCAGIGLNVDISLPSGTYYGNQHVTLSCSDPSAQITYTLDGSDPLESDIVYDPQTGIEISYTCDLKATAGGSVSEAHYDILQYTDQRDPVQQEFYDKAEGTYSTSVEATDNFILKNSTVTIQEPGKPDIVSKYILQDVNGNNANILYTDAQGVNQKMPISIDPQNHTLTYNNKTYTDIWDLRDAAQRQQEETEQMEDEEDY